MAADLDPLRQLGVAIASDHSRFVEFAFNCLTGDRLIPTPFDSIMADVLDRTFTGEIKRLIINIPPRHGKTLRCVWAYVARGYAINPASNFVHTSFSDLLVQENSARIRDIINSSDYQRLFGHVQFRLDTAAKGLWRTSKGGTFLAKPAGGTITGFGAGLAGQNEIDFHGGMIIDDPNKPDDARSERELLKINYRWENTFKSRLNSENAPVIVIMQRISDMDFTSELLERSGANEGWHHLVLPNYIDPDWKYDQSGRCIVHNLPPGPLWPARTSEAQARGSMGNIQFSQSGAPVKGENYQREWFGRYDKLPSNIKSWSIWCDTASKTKQYNDFTVFQLWAKTTENKGYLVRQWRDRVQVPFLRQEFETFYNEAVRITGIPAKSGKLKIGIEDKDSGVGLIQSLKLLGYEITAMSRREGKYARAVGAADNVRIGNVFLPNGPIGDSIINEAVRFRRDDSHAHDDQVDAMADFINHELPAAGAIAPATLWA